MSVFEGEKYSVSKRIINKLSCPFSTLFSTFFQFLTGLWPNYAWCTHRAQSNWPSSCSLEIVRVQVSKQSTAVYNFSASKTIFSSSWFFGELGQQTSVVVTCLTFLRCSFPKGHQRSTQQVVKLTTYCALQCHQNYKSRLINRLFFFLFFPDMISGVELVCSLVPCMYPAKIAPRFMCRAEDRKFWREIEK